MEDYQGYKVGFFINGLNASVSPNQFSFKISDNIYKVFPILELAYSDSSGYFMEFDVFTQGVPINIKYGLTDSENMLNIDFRSSGRDAVSSVRGSQGLNGNMKITGIHNSFFSNREAPHKVLKRTTISDAVKELLNFENDLQVESTLGKLDVYANDDPYRYTRDILLPQATNGKIRPYYFFRNLWNEVHFESLGLLEENTPIEKLIYGGDNPEDNTYNTISSMYPFNEGLEITLQKFHVNSERLANDLSFCKENKTIATDSKDLIPILVNTRINHSKYLGRQFNQNVDYSYINIGLIANTLRQGIFTNKLLANLHFHPTLVSGRTVEIAVALFDENKNPTLSESFSGNWLIEQSTHIWEGHNSIGATQLVLCRSSMKPHKHSLLVDLSFRD